MTEQWFSGRTIVITGAAGGIGRACGRAFAKRGGTVIAGDIGDCQSLLEATADAPGEVHAFEVDVREPAALERLVERATTHGGLDVLVNNAGIVARESIEDLAPDRWHDVLETNLTGAYNAVQAAREPLCNSSGSIVTVSSLLSHIGYSDRVAYSASKGGLDAMTRALATELGSEGVRVNAVNPGFIRTEMTQTHLEAGKEDDFREKTTLDRLGEPEDVAELVTFLASDNAAFISGETILIDGGQAVKG
ncbi:SDR family NAD(P)-dependent oxidoreductase [Natronorubrum texcoconense]|uniref:3-oxoacyl-[acyl-carrier protein] reductase n=1 Tax=Natronorubrum texcoconense TaxID=1095776 RepID=A0A1G9D2G1_9EURY|nr:SDR family NAD(P)-dependent oxidoreductase [Natronorubrum texcoconense]SDK58069.1 3-oxoacyl-[acyl-carrier protein] reductase [Natronorubrum texcoconense]